MSMSSFFISKTKLAKFIFNGISESLDVVKESVTVGAETAFAINVNKRADHLYHSVWIGLCHSVENLLEKFVVVHIYKLLNCYFYGAKI